MPDRSDVFLVPDTPRWRAFGFLVAALGVAATTALIFPLRTAAPAVSLGVVYMLVVLVVSTFWGFWLGLATSVASALAFNWFHIPPTGRFTVSNTENWVALAGLPRRRRDRSTLAEVARARTAEARRRQEEADLGAEMARMLLGGTSLRARRCPSRPIGWRVALGLDAV